MRRAARRGAYRTRELTVPLGFPCDTGLMRAREDAEEWFSKLPRVVAA
jgi:hypothetical protein